MPDTLRIDDDVMPLAAFSVVDDIIDDALFIVIVFFRYQNILGTVGNTAPERDVTGISAHHLDDAATFVGRGSISHLIDRLHRRVDRRIKTDRIIRTGDIQIDRPRNPYRVDPMACQRLCAAVGSVSADHYDSVDSVLSAHFRTFRLSFFIFKFRTAGRTQNRTAPLYRIGHAGSVQIYDFLIQKALVALLDSFHLYTVTDRFSHDRTDRGIHPRRVSAAGKYTYRFDFL